MSEQADIRLIQPGNVIQHNKRLSTYRVVGHCDGGTINAQDMAPMLFVIQEGLTMTHIYLMRPEEERLIAARPVLMLPVTMQISNLEHRPCRWIIYQCIDDSRLWARPADEFQGRFSYVE
jgi:hypothetical protein